MPMHGSALGQTERSQGGMAAVRFVARETAVSVAITAMLSAGFCWLVFGGNMAVPIWGAGGLVADYAPQGLMIGLMGALVPGLLARKSRIADRIGTPDAGSAAAIVRRACAWALVGAGLAVALSAAAFARSGVDALPFSAALAIKIASGVVLALIVTPSAIRAALA